ncbi:polymorphic toxin-type HINT domain-containing protein [Stratiformator vulcanicus]|uniref:Sporulation-specific extracellular nuclease n=1 Tax=Stratiformator vulcanicus TaxID=2527980 RepID=A0A517R5T5_9PLAN|nr:polymorphic toxin-type HINT domain-containing protein [Stratiformator vulcanicus]QDT39257.1 Sporulation-specific extracellular nuclease precursor [Stratiformator vulcanicus]
MTRGWDISATAEPGVTNAELEFCDDEPLRFIAEPRPEPIIKIDDAPTTPARSASKGRNPVPPASLWRVALALTLLLSGGLIAATTFFTTGGATAAVAQNAAPTPEIDTSHRKPIEEIAAGDRVLARDEHGAAIGWREVEEVFERTSDHLRHLKIRSDAGDVQNFETTDEHPFWSATREAWIDAGDLKPGEKLTGPNGESFTLVLTQREAHPEGVTVYNFRVADAHTYYVAANNNPRGPPVLVHNAEYKPGDVQRNALDADKYPEAAKHLKDANGVGKPLTVDRLGADRRRREALKSVPTKPRLDRDEAPPAVFAEGSTSVRHIPPSDNRGAGAVIGNKLRGILDGARVIIDLISGS